MRVSINKFCQLTAILALTTVFSFPAHAGWVSKETVLINGGKELPNGVPNYDMDDFYNENDCGPTAAAMVLGYWDANGWPCLVTGSPYAWYQKPGFSTHKRPVANKDPADFANPYDPETKFDAVYQMQYGLEQELPYDQDGDWGTWDFEVWAPGIAGSLGEDVVQAAENQMSHLVGSLDDWHANDDEVVDQSRIRGEIDEDRPMMWLVGINMGFDVEGVWDNGDEKDLWVHWTTIMGYEDVTKVTWGGCDWCWADDFYMFMRSGYRQGGDSWIKVMWHWYDNYYTIDIQPGAERAACVDQRDRDNDSYPDANTPPGYTAGDDCLDVGHDHWVPAASINPAAVELCDYVDNDCNGLVDDGAPDADNDGVCDSHDEDRDGDEINNDNDSCPDYNPITSGGPYAPGISAPMRSFVRCTSETSDGCRITSVTCGGEPRQGILGPLKFGGFTPLFQNLKFNFQFRF